MAIINFLYVFVCMKESQLERIKGKLKRDGFITRNECLKNYISRLGARINDLRNEGWNIKSERIKTPYGEDYKYTLTEK